MRKSFIYLVVLIFIINSCSLVKERNSFLLIPDEITDQQDNSRKFPLVIYLHGAGRAGELDFLKNIGIDSIEDLQNPHCDHLLKSHTPCYLWIPETRGDWDTRVLIRRLEKLKKKNSIDENRIYVIGYSMGGPATYRLANDYFNRKNKFFAAIVRLAGQSETEVDKPVAQNTAVWLQIGNQDQQRRVDITEKAYRMLKKQLEISEERRIEHFIGDTKCATKSLLFNDVEHVKFTIYENTGHGISGFPLQNKNLVEWMFSKTLTSSH